MEIDNEKIIKLAKAVRMLENSMFEAEIGYLGTQEVIVIHGDIVTPSDPKSRKEILDAIIYANYLLNDDVAVNPLVINLLSN